MGKYFSASLIVVISALVLTACGGGGGGGGGGPTTQAITKVYLYGNMSSNSRIASVAASMIVPAGVMVNYSGTSGLCNLRRGVIVPSGPLKLAANDFSSSSYETNSRKLSLNMLNNSFLNLSSSTLGNGGKGREFATITFALEKPGVTPSSMPLEDQNVVVMQGRPAATTLNGCKINFVTTYQ